MSIPKKVREQQEMAMNKAKPATQEPLAVEPTPIEPSVEEPPAPAEPAEPAPVELTPQEPAQPTEPEPEPKPAPEPKKDSQYTGMSEDDLRKELARKDQSLRVLKSKYDAEVPRLAAEVKEMRELANNLLKMNQQNAQAPVAPTATGNEPGAPVAPPATRLPKGDAGTGDIDLTQFYTDEEIEDFGEDFLTRTLMGTRKIAESQVSPVLKEQQELQRRLETQNQNSFLGQLRTLIPGFDEQNTDYGFIDYLEKTPVSEFSTRTIKDELQDAQTSFDAERVAKIFKSYNPGGGDSPVLPSVESQVVPRSKSAPTPSPASHGKPTYTVEQFQDQMETVRRIKDPGLRLKKMQELNQAAAEGRVESR